VAAPGQVQCRNCGYRNDTTRIRCERCGIELRNARPRGTQPAPPVYAQQASRRGGSFWLIVLIILAVVALVVLGLTLLWLSLK
jgi:hypothetical protein